MTTPPRYAEQIEQEADHWGSVHPDPRHPQLWHDPYLVQLFFGKELTMMRRSALANGPDVLELGCGEGMLSVSLAAEGLSVTGIDLSPERIQRAQRRAGEQGVSQRTTFRVADLNSTVLGTEAYSCILAHDSLHHILRLDHLLDQVRNALTKDGVFLVMDYSGMGPIRKILAAGIAAILPTYLPYRTKWNSRKRLRAFMASEHAKREALESGDASLLHPDSPFEEISQGSIVPEVSRRFVVQHYHTYLPFCFYLAPKIRVPAFLRTPWARSMRSLDSMATLFGMRGAYFYLEASKGSHASGSR